MLPIMQSNGATNGHTLSNEPTLNGDAIEGYVNGHTTNGISGNATNSHMEPIQGNGVENNLTTNGFPSVKGDTVTRNTSTNKPPKPVAICGMACRLPSGIKTPQQLWSFLLAGGDARSRIPESRYNIEAFYDPSGKPGTTKTQHGYFLDEDLANLDTSFFSMPRKEVERIDPQQRLLLEVARECFEDAGETGWRGKKIGCYVGNLGDDWLEMLAQDTQNFGIYRLSGYGDFSLSNRISYEMNLQGPSMTVRTACSASMVALHEACVAIDRGDCESAIVGGTNIILRPSCTTMMSEQGVLSPDGSCKTFSSAANGYARGEAIVGVFVKPLEAAVRDGNSIRAVIRATATNHDGKTAGFSLPSSDAQETMMRRAYDVAGLAVSETGYVECHGTGTSVGDPIETNAVARVFGDGGITIGSTKPNFGHTEGASGILSVLKTVLALENKTIPPSIKSMPRNPNIPWESGKLVLADEPISWPKGRLFRASVNSFGLGGSNAHAIIDSAEAYIPVRVAEEVFEIPQLFLYSANTEKSLTTLIDNYKTFVEEFSPNVKDVAYTLARGREHLPYRAFAIANGLYLGAASAITKSSQQKPKIAMVFTGQGAQWPQMGSDLLKYHPVFQASIRSLDQHLNQTLGEEAPTWSIESELLKPGNKSRVNNAAFSQPLCTAFQIALVDTLRSIGVEADAVVGHSSGEIAAAYASGALTAGEAIIAAYYRGTIAKKLDKAGAMAALGMSVADATRFLLPNTNIACDNSPRSVTISGDADSVEAVLAAVRTGRPDVLARKLQVDKAYHSHHMAEVGRIYNASIEDRIVAKTPSKLFFSSVEDELINESTTLGSRYWQKNLESPVLFNGAATKLLHHFSYQDVIFLEVGPHSALAGPLTQIMTETPNSAKYIPTVVRKQNSLENLLSVAGKLFSLHIPLHLKALFPSGSCLADLPRYPFNHGETGHWFESRLSKDFRHRKYPHHDILGARVMESTDLEPSWRNLLHVDHNSTWLNDHKVGDDIVFPFAGYVAMAGEAVRQITKVDDAFCLRHISVGTAMLLSEEKPTEVITTFRPLRLTITQDSAWYEFTVSAYNGHQWTKHCSGEVRPEPAGLRNGVSSSPFPRSVDAEKWFDGVRHEGLDLATNFQNLDHITASTTTREAQGIVLSKKHPKNRLSEYHIHPAVLDSALQLLSVASSQGLIRKHKNFLPIFCQEIMIGRTESDFVTNVEITNMGNGSTSSRIGRGEGVANGKVVLRFNGLKITPASITHDPVNAPDPHAASRLTWAPHIDFADIRVLCRQYSTRQLFTGSLERLSELYILRAKRLLDSVEPSKRRADQYARWINSQAELLGDISYDDETLSQQIQQLHAILIETPAASVAKTLKAVIADLESLVTGTIPSWTLLLSDENLEKFFDFVAELDSSAFFKTLGHSKPNLRVLEIGNYSKSPSTTAISSLTLPGGQHLWSHYTFATTYLVANEERLTGYPNLEYLTLDIRESPAAQGLEHRQYDLIIVNDAFSSVSSVSQSLKNVSELLTPNGYLFVQEFSVSTKWLSLIMGSTPDWWHRTTVDTKEASVSAHDWQVALGAAGLGAPEAILLDSEDKSRLSNTVVARPPLPVRLDSQRLLHLLVREKNRTYDKIERLLSKHGYDVVKITLDDTPKPGADIVSIIDLDGPFFENIADRPYNAFQKFITSLESSGVFWITRPCHIRVEDPRYAQVIGLARVVRSELLIDFATCEIDDTDTSLSLAIHAVEKFCARNHDDTLSPDFEYAINRTAVHVGRYFPFVMMDKFIRETSGERMKVAIGTPGRLNTLHWVRQPDFMALGDHELEIEMHAVGVNFKDVLVGMNLIDHVGRYHGLEGAGTVRRVGSKVQDFKPGDRVAAMEHNMLSTLLIAHEVMCVKIPDSLSLIDAATMFTVYATVQQSLITVGRLRKGESLLIHSACGGVGLAAIQIAQMLGAEIFATVGSEEKAQYLTENCNIPRNRIFNSRDNSFVEGILRETNGKGVDQALNSLSGELLHETWRCIAPYGKLIEIGKRELIGHGRLDMEPFVANRSYCCVDIDAFYDVTKSRFKEMMTETIDYLQKGLIKPIPIAKEFDASSVAEAFRYLLPGTHIGRVGIRIRDVGGKPTSKDQIVNPPRNLEIDSEASFLLVGGLGGLGRSISTYMVEHGARHLIYLGRRAGESDADQAFIGELKSMGAGVTTVRGNVNELDDVSRAVEEARRPLKGVLQLSAVQADENFARLTKEQWDYSLGPKVTGTWNLHHATKGIELDFFLLFSSMSSVIGLPGQANYASGNSFLDAFVQYRNNLGLACSSVDIGPVADVGFLSERTALLQTATLTGFKTLQEQEMLDSIALSMMAELPKHSEYSSTFYDPNCFVLGLESTIPLSSPANRAVWKKDRRMAIYHNDSRSAAGTPETLDQLKSYIAKCRADPAVLKSPEAANFFAREIGKRLFGLLLKDDRDLNTDLSLADLGLDSLVAIELRGWWKQAFGFDISVLEMLNMGNLEALGEHVCERLLQNISDQSRKE